MTPADTDNGAPHDHRAPVVIRLAATECLALLGRSTIGRIALTVDAMPTVRTVAFTLLHRTVVARVAPGSRLCRAATGSVVAFQADHYDLAGREGWSVVVQGICSQVTEPETLEALRGLPLGRWSEPPLEDRFVEIPASVVTGERVLWPVAP